MSNQKITKLSESCDCNIEVEALADVIIIGGGVSGLTSAYKIFEAEPSIKVMILESSEILGGQIYKTYCSQELGAKFIKNDHTQVICLLEELGISWKPREKEPNLKDVSTFENGSLSSFCRLETRRFLNYMNLISKEYQYGSFNIARTKGNTMEAYINKKLLFPKSKKYAKLIVRLTCGVDAENATVSEFLAACSSCGSSQNIKDLYFGEANEVLEVDTNELIESLICVVSDHVLIKTNSRVIEVFFSGEQYLIKDSQCKIYKSTVLVLAIPWNSVMQLDISPALPLDCRVPYLQCRSLMSSFCATYKQAYWKDLGYSGSLVLDDEQPLICFQSKPMTLCGIVLHNDQKVTSIDKVSILERLMPYFGEDILNTSSFAVRCFEQGTILNHPQMEPFLNLIWASSCGSAVNRGLLSGSIESGFRAAINVTKILRPETKDLIQEEEEELSIEKVGIFKKFVASLNLKEGLYFTAALASSLVTYKVVKLFLRSKDV